MSYLSGWTNPFREERVDALGALNSYGGTHEDKVRAWQETWNAQNPDPKEQLRVDGVIGPDTYSAMLGLKSAADNRVKDQRFQRREFESRIRSKNLEYEDYLPDNPIQRFATKIGILDPNSRPKNQTEGTIEKTVGSFFDNVTKDMGTDTIRRIQERYNDNIDFRSLNPNLKIRVDGKMGPQTWDAISQEGWQSDDVLRAVRDRAMQKANADRFAGWVQSRTAQEKERERKRPKTAASTTNYKAAQKWARDKQTKSERTQFKKNQSKVTGRIASGQTTAQKAQADYFAGRYGTK